MSTRTRTKACSRPVADADQGLGSLIEHRKAVEVAKARYDDVDIEHRVELENNKAAVDDSISQHDGTATHTEAMDHHERLGAIGDIAKYFIRMTGFASVDRSQE
jgi:hypothetical protein